MINTVSIKAQSRLSVLAETVMRHFSCNSLSVAVMITFMLLWHVRVTGHLSFGFVAFLGGFILLCLSYGRAFFVAIKPLVIARAGLSLRFLCGFILFNTFLFVLSLVSPLGMPINVLLLSSIGLSLPFFGRRHEPNLDEVAVNLPNLLCIALSGAAATLWCSDSQMPLHVQDGKIVYQVWQDMFFHVREISTFAQAHGIATIHDISFSGAPAPVYHYASYISSAAVSALTGTSAIDVYSSFQLPFGIFLTGLAAFSLIASFWGGWPALAAVVAVLLVPDAYQQGFANRYLSYNFLAQVNLGMLYGIACAATGWIFIVEGTRRGKIAPLVVGYGFMAICLFYKAHIFVANSFLALIYPCLFFSGLQRARRLIVGIVLVGIFASVAVFSQSIARVPVIRLDGSGIGSYVVVLLKDFDPGLLKTFFTRVFRLEHHSRPVELFYIVAMLLASTFGIWTAATVAVVAIGRAKIPAALLCFPLLVVANYLVMSIGLAMDTHGVGTPDELINRPLVWAYFVVAAWTAGGAYHLAVGRNSPPSAKARLALLAVACLSLAGPLVFSRNLQTFPTRPGYERYEQFGSVPVCLVRASQYIRNNSRTDEIVQDSDNDPRYVVTALSERQRFAGDSIFGGHTKQLRERLDGLVGFKALHDAAEVETFAASHGISWYLLHPDSSISWPVSVVQTAVFECDGYRVFHFRR
jgi:hypothetical protein